MTAPRDDVTLSGARTLIILNPAAGQEDPDAMRRRIGGAFAERRAAFDLVETTHAGHASDLARSAASQGYRAVAVCGGDGTIAEAASGLAGSSTPLGIIPLGTANQVAHNLGIPLTVDAAIGTLLTGRATPIDIGRVERQSTAEDFGWIDSRYFALIAGAGFDAAVMRAATRELKERWGFGAYVYAAVREALAAAPRRFQLVADGRDVEVDAVSVMVANVGELFAGWLPLRLSLAPQPTNAWHDGLLDVVIVAPRRMPDMAGILWRAARRKFSGSDHLMHFQTHEITIAADPPIDVQIDGDPAGTTPIRASVMRDALHVVLPV